jgi:hypothetical protein
MRLDPRLSTRHRKIVRDLMMGVPAFAGSPVSISVRPELSVSGRKLLSGVTGRGTPVYAASFIRNREIILESSLLLNEPAFRFIFAHEVFHFLWARMGNKLRQSYDALLRHEYGRRARGELGESSAVKKVDCAGSFRCWKDYVCESFCDTGAWLYSGVKECEAFTLAARWRRKREDWFRTQFERYTGV